MMAGGMYVESLSNMLSYYQERKHLLVTLKPALSKCAMSSKAAQWVLMNLPIVTPKTLKLVDYLYT